MVLVYSHTTSPRLLYTLDFLSNYYGQPFTLVCNKEAFEKGEGVKIAYSHESLENDLQIPPVELLFQNTIHPVSINCFKHPEGFTAFFDTGNNELRFDLFAAIFYLLSRYEEYLPHQKDEYGRFAHQNSLAFNNGFLNIPLINIWLKYFWKLLASKDSNLKPQTSNFSFLPTYDIDMAWSYRQKGVVRNAGGLLRSIVKRQLSNARDRIAVLSGKTKDPFDCFDWLNDLHKQHALQPVYFFLVGTVRNTYDKNIPPTNKAFQNVIADTSKNATVGVHPSWYSGDVPAAINKEKIAIEAILQKPVTASRQHYIRFSLPQTFRQLLAAGITDDYSMGYGSINGFRASVASPFYWYDLTNEKQTVLRLHPFCFMDANSYYEQKQTAAETWTELLHYYEQVKGVNGKLITVWHNTILGTAQEFSGWREVYQKFLTKVTS